MQGEFRARFQAETPEEECEQIEAFASGMVRANVAWFRRHPGEFPCCLGAAGVKYEEPPKCEAWCQYADTAPVMLERAQATCLAVCAYVAAMYILAGVQAVVVIVPMVDPVYQKPVPHQWHALVLFANGEFLDPTLQLVEEPNTCVCPLDGRTT